MKKYLLLLGVAVFSLSINSNAMAQDVPVAQEQNAPSEPAQENADASSLAQTPEKVKYQFSVDTFPSLLFTYWEQVAIEDARNSTGQNRAPTDSEIGRVLGTDTDDERVMPPPEERNIALSGIAYKGNKNWTIWLNGKRVTPDAIPEEAIDLKVFKQYIEIKWFDEYTNQIIPIRLRAHQRFNIDNRMFLPG
ncbi:MAG: hypothetical protein GW778_03665 [Alphaproteobacteria bacterium]|nr:hypothetical protein [Alphaproteobacteria bacterium]